MDVERKVYMLDYGVYMKWGMSGLFVELSCFVSEMQKYYRFILQNLHISKKSSTFAAISCKD